MLKFVSQSYNRSRILTDNQSVIDFLDSKYTIVNPVHRFYKSAPKFLSPLSPLKAFNNGLFLDIYQNLRIKFPNEEIEIEPAVRKNVIPFNISLNPDVSTGVESVVFPENNKFVYYPYQLSAIIKGMKFGRGIFEYATAAGKSLIIYGLIRNIQKRVFVGNGKILLLVPNTQLVMQMYKDFMEYGCPESDITMFSAENRSPVFNDIIISNRQWLERHSDELPKIDALFVDECHQLKGTNGVTKFVNSLMTNVRFGFTGTMPTEQNDVWSLVGTIGKVLDTIKPSELQSGNFISKCKIVNVHFSHISQPEEPDPTLFAHIEDDELRRIATMKAKYPLEWKFIEKSDGFNKTVTEFVIKLPKNTIILFDHNEHGDAIRNWFTKYFHTKKIFYINGDTPLDYREQVRMDMEESDNCVCIANTACFKQGINIKNIHNIVFMFAHGKSNVKILQSIGRALRKLASKDEGATIYDISHNCTYSMRHYGHRKEYYLSAYGIDEKDIKRFQFRIA